MMQNKANHKFLLFLQGIKFSVPIALAYLSVSFSFGVAAAAGGLDWKWALMMSMTNLTSAGQFAGLSIITAGGTLFEIALSQLVINLRYVLMSLSLSQKISDNFTLGDRFCVSYGITDEIFAVASDRKGKVEPSFMYGLISLPYVSWALGTLLGGLLGSLLPEWLCSILGLAIYGMFISIVITPAKHSKGIAFVALTACALSTVLKYWNVFAFVSDGFAIIICGMFSAVMGALLFPVAGRKRSENE